MRFVIVFNFKAIIHQCVRKTVLGFPKKSVYFNKFRLVALQKIEPHFVFLPSRNRLLLHNNCRLKTNINSISFDCTRKQNGKTALVRLKTSHVFLLNKNKNRLYPTIRAYLRTRLCHHKIKRLLVFLSCI